VQLQVQNSATLHVHAPQPSTPHAFLLTRSTNQPCKASITSPATAVNTPEACHGTADQLSNTRHTESPTCPLWKHQAYAVQQDISHHLCVLQTTSAFEHQLRSHSESTVLSRQSATSQPAFCCDQVSPWYTGPPSVISLTVQSAWRQAFTLTRSVPHNRPICLSAGRSPLTRGSKSHLHPTCTQHAPCADAQDTIP